MSDEARRANQRKQGSGCPRCGGGVWLGSGWLPHAKGCPRKPRTPQPYRDQDRERAVLTDDWPHFPPVSFDVEGIPRSG